MLHFMLQTRESESTVQKTRRFHESLWHAASKKVWTNISWVTLQNLTPNWIKLPVLSATDEDCVTMGILKGCVYLIRDAPPIMLNAAWEARVNPVLMWIHSPVASRFEEVCLVAVVLL